MPRRLGRPAGSGAGVAARATVPAAAVDADEAGATAGGAHGGGVTDADGRVVTATQRRGRDRDDGSRRRPPAAADAGVTKAAMRGVPA